LPDPLDEVAPAGLDELDQRLDDMEAEIRRIGAALRALSAAVRRGGK
jgi:uncharacterized small protein (DUF1192 family)